MRASARELHETMTVTEVFRMRSGDTYPVCPRCRTTLEREYQRFCDRCGQKLNWRGYRGASVIRAC